MSDEEAFMTFLASLFLHIQEQVTAHIHGDLSAAITIAERLDLFCASAQEGTGASGSSGAQYKAPKGGPRKKKGGVHSIEENKEGTFKIAFIKENENQKTGEAMLGRKD